MLNFLLENLPRAPSRFISLLLQGEEMPQRSPREAQQGGDLEAQSPNHWTAREVPWMGFYGAEPALGDKGGYHQLWAGRCPPGSRILQWGSQAHCGGVR